MEQTLEDFAAKAGALWSELVAALGGAEAVAQYGEAAARALDGPFFNFVLLALIVFALRRGAHNGKICLNLAETLKKMRESKDDLGDQVKAAALDAQEEATAGLKTQIRELAGDVRQTVSATQDQIKKLLEQTGGADELQKQMEKQTLYLYDRFAEMQNLLQKPADANGDDKNFRAEVMEKMAEAARADRELLQKELSQVGEALRESVNRLTGEVDAKLEVLAGKLGKDFQGSVGGAADAIKGMSEGLESRLAAVGELLQKSREEAGRERVSFVSQMMTGPAAVGDRRLADMLAMSLPENAYDLNRDVGGRKAAALILPESGETVLIDDSLPCDNPAALAVEREQTALDEFDVALRAHINAVADALIAPPKTAGAAFLYVSSELLYAHIHAMCPQALELAASRRVWLVSPTTLLAALTMARGAIGDYQARHRLQQMQTAMSEALEQARAFEARLLEIGDHIGNAMRSVHRAESAGAQFVGRLRNAAGEPARERLEKS